MKFETWQEFSNWTFSNIPLCGCGNPDLVVNALAECLKAVRDKQAAPDFASTLAIWNAWETKRTELELWLIVYALDHAELTEHGGGLGSGGWLTPLGEEWLACLEKWGSATEEPGEGA